jgi:hypothetical protein
MDVKESETVKQTMSASCRGRLGPGGVASACRAELARLADQLLTSTPRQKAKWSLISAAASFGSG